MTGFVPPPYPCDRLNDLGAPEVSSAQASAS